MRLCDVVGGSTVDSIMRGKEVDPSALPESNSGVESFSNSALNSDKYLRAIKISTHQMMRKNSPGAWKTPWITSTTV
jgi:hypothetical protein